MRLAALLLIALAASTGRAQEVTGSVRAGAEGTPVAGAIVILISSTSARVGGTLTDDAGHYRLRAPEAGTFSLRVDVVGYRSVTVPPFSLDAGAPITRDVRFTFERTQLPTVAVTATSACARVVDESGDAPRLWTEARKTLEASRLAIDERRFTVALRRHERTIGLPDSVLRASRTWTQTAVSENPFESLSPEEIARNGFFARQDSSRLYYAPDAKVLLSDLFVGSHCFGTRRGGPGGAIGLTFRPQRASERVDISGVLWIDSASAELRSLEYRYQPALSRREPGGGTVTFGRYPSGIWGVVRWSIRLPVLQVFESRRRPDGALGDFADTLVVALRDVGGEVVASGTGSTSTASGPRLRGTVFDSTSSAPLRGAMVTLEGLGRTVETDLNGQFVFDSLVEEGDVRLRAWHPRLDSLGLPALAARVSLRRRSETVTDLTSGGIADVARQRCPRELRSAPRIILGTLRSAADSVLAGSEVVLLERRSSADGRDSLVRHIAISSETGRYAFCNVQPSTQSWVLAREGADWLNPRHVNGVEAPAVEVIPLRGLASDTATDSSRVTGAPVVILGRTLRDGPPQLAGWVLLPENSEARVQVLVDDVPRVTAAPDGSFDVPDVAIGTHRVSFRAPGMATRHVLVAMETGQSALMVVALRVAPVVVVRGTSGPPPDLRLAGFYTRRRMGGGGTFMDRADIERRNARSLSDMMRGVTGVRIVTEGSQMRYVSAHFQRMTQGAAGPTAALCDMMLYIDGQPFQGDATSADARVRMTEVVGIEVYTSAASVPREFAGQSAACGVIVIWLGR